MTEKLKQYDIYRKIYRKMLADYFSESEDEAMYRVEEFEQKVKQRFIDEPGQMRLLIVVDKLITGFDARQLLTYTLTSRGEIMIYFKQFAASTA